MKEFFELRDLKELLFGSSTPKPEQAGTVWIPVQEGLYDLNLYYDIVQVCTIYHNMYNVHVPYMVHVHCTYYGICMYYIMVYACIMVYIP